MQYHVFAVWDFMSLLKTLQKNLTCTEVPWFPQGDAEIRYLINEIVIGEESDIDNCGNRKSHFEIYLDAMKQCGADTNQIEKFITSLKLKKNLKIAYTDSLAPIEASEFVDFTFNIIKSNKIHLQAAVFTFGREDLISGMFVSLINDIHKNFPNSVSIFKYYLDRHIEVDGEHHSNLALKMTIKLCESSDEYWQEATQAIIKSLQKRINLWDAVYREIEKRKEIRNN